ncbi:glycosyltransferase family 2 protein [[Clostridium] polysaccharolyticum]|uniref:Glycosyltransferase involved in cell wall bisynthesis n=1 Tax=[Clostridium] polysaccharolyticum TaxID=29364 RepID=A0A1I0G1V3_9FIRM|nr:glycosyltransferase family 2 protein [[Clostridium] polysaccharolyticum]SET64570.1 Glycosyltransferase involved in cell wall bisynthesis [[Clostridium] polysaccharolyticum]
MEEKVSVIIPVFNREKVIHRAINSVLNQEYNHLEIIIVDDHSTDNTRKVVEEYMEKDARICYCLNENKQGPAGARNTGIKKATGTYIAFLDSDDEWLTFHLSESVEAIEQHGVDVCFALWYEKNLQGDCKEPFGDGNGRQRIEKLVKTLKPIEVGDYLIFDDHLIEYVILERFYFYHINTLVFRRKIIEDNGVLFNEDLGTNEDLDFSMNLFDLSKVCLIRKCHFIYYQGTDNLYAFMNRANFSLESIIENKRLVRKMSYCDYNKAKMFTLRKDFIRRANKITKKTECVKECNDRIGKKYFTIGILNQKLRPYYAIKSIMVSMRYEARWYKVVCILRILFRKSCLEVPEGSLYFT